MVIRKCEHVSNAEQNYYANKCSQYLLLLYCYENIMFDHWYTILWMVFFSLLFFLQEKKKTKEAYLSISSLFMTQSTYEQTWDNGYSFWFCLPLSYIANSWDIRHVPALSNNKIDFIKKLWCCNLRYNAKQMTEISTDI